MSGSKATQYPPQDGAYAVKVKNGAGWNAFDTARLQISVGQPYHEGDKLAALLRENPTFDSVYGGEMVFQDNGVAKKRVALFEVDENGQGVFQKYITIQ